jgi:hypothetical protein
MRTQGQNRGDLSRLPLKGNGSVKAYPWIQTANKHLHGNTTIRELMETVVCIFPTLKLHKEAPSVVTYFTFTFITSRFSPVGEDYRNIGLTEIWSLV